MKLGKLEKQILRVLELPYPKHPSGDIIINGKRIYGYPIHGSDTKNLIRAICGESGLDRGIYFQGSAQASMSRALNNLRRKGLVARLQPQRTLDGHSYTLKYDNLRNPDTVCTELPHSTKSWWVLARDFVVE
ncbi:hypothetical protein ES708_11388 [subsurface metagenome]